MNVLCMLVSIYVCITLARMFFSSFIIYSHCQSFVSMQFQIWIDEWILFDFVFWGKNFHFQFHPNEKRNKQKISKTAWPSIWVLALAKIVNYGHENNVIRYVEDESTFLRERERNWEKGQKMYGLQIGSVCVLYVCARTLKNAVPFPQPHKYFLHTIRAIEIQIRASARHTYTHIHIYC